VLLQIDISFLNIVFALSLVSLISAIPISVGGHGVRELTLVFFLSLFDVSTDQVIALVAISYIQRIIFSFSAVLFLIDFAKFNYKSSHILKSKT